MKVWAKQKQQGFTIVELLIVIVVIGILAAVTVVAYNGVQSRARQAKAQADIANVQKLVEAYNAENGHYPVTAASLNLDWYSATARTDANCSVGGALKMAQWVPDVTSKLPQSDDTKGVGGTRGCYMYVSDGQSYVLSAWNMVDAPQVNKMYRRLGLREVDANPDHNNQFYTCNHSSIGGADGGYNANNDYYKHSFTVSNVTSCNETPPGGA